jgi:pyrimidine operon attenuation protein/uracil phosphoribosyltransferase
MKVNYQLMKAEEVTTTLDRMADDILKANEAGLVLIGIQRRGGNGAAHGAHIAEKTRREPQIGTLDINLFETI